MSETEKVPIKEDSEPPRNADDEAPVEEESGISLDQLSEAYAELLQQEADPVPHAEPREDSSAAGETMSDEPATDVTQVDEADACEISPKSILEAMLFVGSPDNLPLTSQQVASLMRGVKPPEVDQLVQQLNDQYAEGGSPYRIIAEDAGYRMVIDEQHRDLRDKFYGRVKQARLSQAAVDILAIVAYNQPATRPEIDQLRGAPSGSLLTQLVRRQLLAISRTDEKPRKTRYVTTQRFLDLFRLASLDDLPRQEGERTG